MDNDMLVLRKTIRQYNRNNQEKGYKVKHHIRNKNNKTVLCQIFVTHMPDNHTIDKFILLDPSLDI